MASNKIKLILLVFLAISTYCKAKLGHRKETEMIVYIQEYTGDQNTTAIEISGPSTPPLNTTRFGAMFVTDNPISEEIEGGPVPIARGQAMYVVTALDGTRALMIASIVFVNGEYEGSTLEMQGSYAQFEPVTEVAVVGGTGKFRLARGHATFETLYYDPVLGYALIRSNMTVLHYVLNSTSSN